MGIGLNALLVDGYVLSTMQKMEILDAFAELTDNPFDDQKRKVFIFQDDEYEIEPIKKAIKMKRKSLAQIYHQY
jgi:hypothetical protein